MTQSFSGYSQSALTLTTGAYTITATGTINATGNAAVLAPQSDTALRNLGLVEDASGYGIVFMASGSLNNDGTVTGDAAAALFEARSSVSNSGLIKGVSIGLELWGGGTVTNVTGGKIDGGYGVVIDGTSIGSSLNNQGSIIGDHNFGVRLGEDSSMTNSGHVVSNFNDGVFLYAANQLTNAMGGTISGVYAGVVAYNPSHLASTIVNAGLLTATGTNVASNHNYATYGAQMLEGGFFSNSNTGTVVATAGFLGVGNIIMANAGTVTGRSSVAVDLIGSNLSFSNSGIIGGEYALWLNPGTAAMNTATIFNTGTMLSLYDAITVGETFKPGEGIFINDGLITSTAVTQDYKGHTYTISAIQVDGGAIITNGSSGSIIGAGYGIGAFSGPGMISIGNAGTIRGADGAINSSTGETLMITNAGLLTSTAAQNVVRGSTFNVGSVLLGAGSQLVNEKGGVITATGFAVGEFSGSGSAFISNSGSISGGAGGILAGAAEKVTLTNAGTISSPHDSAVQLDGSGTVTNGSGGVITGVMGVFAGAGTTVVNAGTIAGTGGDAVYLAGAARVVDDPGAEFVGAVADVAGTGILELGTGAAAGTIASFNSAFSGFNTAIVDSGADWALAGTIATLTDNGTIAIATSLDVSGTVGTASSGIFQITGNGRLEIATMLGGSTIAFLGTSSGHLTIDHAANFGQNVGKSTYSGPLLEDLKAGDVIDLKTIAASGLILNYSASTGDLQVTSASGSILATLRFQNSSLGSGSFHAATDNAGGVLISHS